MSRIGIPMGLTVAAIVAANATAAAPLADPGTIVRAGAIRAELDARYRHVPGRGLAVTEASTTGVVESFTLLSGDLLEARTVPADNGVYFAICAPRATCPYPARRLARPVADLLPRRLALELALRIFVETPATLVVVALPTSRPVWVVLERDDLRDDGTARALLDQLASTRAQAEASVQEFVRRLTLPRLYDPLAILPPPSDTIYAVQRVPR